MTTLVEIVRSLRFVAKREAKEGEYPVQEHIDWMAADEIERLEEKCADEKILRAFFEAVCDDNWEVANGIRAALRPIAALDSKEQT